jgi:hypothetical protein
MEGAIVLVGIALTLAWCIFVFWAAWRLLLWAFGD